MNSVGILNLTDGINPSVFNSSCQQYRRIYRRIYSVGISYTHGRIYQRIFSVGQSQYHRRNENPSVYFKRESLFFWRANFVCKTIGKWFFCFSDGQSDGREITDEGKADGHNLSVMTSVKKSPTNFLSHTDGIGPSVKL